MGEPTTTRSISQIDLPPSLSLWRRLWSWARSFARWTTWIYVVLLLVLLPSLEWLGERNWLLSLLLYAPPQLLAAPLLLLTPFCAIFRPQSLILHGVCIVVIFFGFMTFRWSSRPPANQKRLTLVTYNVGEGDREQFLGFAGRNSPGVVLLQDVRMGNVNYPRLFPGTYSMNRGEFTVISRYRIVRGDLLPKPLWRGRPVAARFELLFDDQKLVIYNVHLPTPRSQFNRFLSKRVVTDLVGDEDHAGGFASYREWIEARRAMAQELANVFASESQPFLACGDFNTPDHGFIYHLFASRMTDAHAKAGRGHGMTFPCDVKRVVDVFGPWLRIDYAFAGRGWEPLYCEADTATLSQHRPVAAQFSPAPSR